MKSIKSHHLMNKETIQKNEEPKTAVFIAYFCLVCAVLLSIGEMGDFSYNHLLVLGSILLIGVILWPFHMKNKWKAALFLLFSYFLCFCLLRRPLDEQLNVLLYCLMNQKTGSGDFTLLFLALSLLVSLFCLFLVPVLNKGWLVYNFTMFILLTGPLLGYRPSFTVLGLLAAFHIENSIYCTVYQKWSDETEEKNTRAIVLKKSFAAGLLLVLGVFLLARLVPAKIRKNWMKETAQFAQFLPREVKSPLSSTASYSASENHQMEVRMGSYAAKSSGKISRGSHYASGVLQLELTLSKMPEERLYLKDFTGGDYQGDTWAEADETDFYAEVNSRQEESLSSYLTPEYFERRQFEMIRYGKRETKTEGNRISGDLSVTEPENQKMEVHPVNGAKNSFFYPYLSSYISRDSRGVCFFDWFTWNEYYQYQEKLGEKPLQWFAQMEEPYQSYAASHYLSVPEERLPRLLALCREHPLEDPKAITLWIRQTLADSAVYSQTPGFMPYGTDIAEHFLFDGKEGYCQHFATAAVLMYRMQGIPARYITGYAADPEDFSLETDGQYHAYLTDEKAHAWAEIYLGGPGWLPVEVTPPEDFAEKDGNLHPAEKELQNQQDWLLSFVQEESEGKGQEEEKDFAGGADGEENSGEKDWEEGSSGQTDEENPEQPEENVQAENENEEKFKESQKEGNYGISAVVGMLLGIAGMAALLVLLFAAAVWAGRRQRAKRLRQLGADELYQKLVALLHQGGYVKEFDGTEPEFCRAAIAQLNHHAPATCPVTENKSLPKKDLKLSVDAGDGKVPLEELEKIRGYAFQTAYGREVSSDKERETVQEGYEKMAAELARRQQGMKKIKWYIMETMLVWEK